jgi:hypothetical protein
VVVDHLFEEELGGQALALQAPLHVGEGEHDRVDRALTHLDAQLLKREQATSAAARVGMEHGAGVPSSGREFALDRGQFLGRALDPSGPLNQCLAETSQ